MRGSKDGRVEKSERRNFRIERWNARNMREARYIRRKGFENRQPAI